MMRPFASCAFMRIPSVFVPRRQSQASNGPGTAPAALRMNWRRVASSSLEVTAMPPIMSLCPLRYLVLECQTMSAPVSSGRWKIGVAKVLSTIVSAPARLAMSAAAARSVKPHQRIGRRFQHHRAGGRSDGVGDMLRIARVDIRECESELLQQLVEQTVRPAIHILADDDVITGPEEHHHARQAPHATPEREAVLRAFQRGHISFERFAGRVLSPSVLVAAMHAKLFMDVRAREIQGRHDRATDRHPAAVRRESRAWTDHRAGRFRKCESSESGKWSGES